MVPEVTLRPVTDEDVSVFFDYLNDPVAARMAAFVPKGPPDRAAHVEHWAANRAHPTRVARTILAGDRVAGHVVAYRHEGRRYCAYWVGREFWGVGIATRGLRLLLQEVPDRPAYARVAADNIASIHVLEKCGFVRVATERGFAGARDQELEEYVYELGGPSA